LATAIRLADLLRGAGLERRIMLIDKGSSIGSHILSGAIIRPAIFSELLTAEEAAALPLNAKTTSDATVLLGANSHFRSPIHAPYMGNKGTIAASLGVLCRYLAEKAQARGVEIYPGFSMSELLYDQQGNVTGAKAIDTGVDHNGAPLDNFQPGTVVEAKLTILAEGSRGSLTRKLIEKAGLQSGRNPQVYSLGCKELWSVPEGRIKPGQVCHTLGYPLNMKEFGGGFIYGLNDNQVALGLVVGLDYADPTFDIHAAFQVWKKHPMISRILEGGRLLEYGAKTLPEGGWYSLPKPYTGGALIVGDSAGFLTMPALKGVHLAVRSGMLAAETVAEALQKGDFSDAALASYETKVAGSQLYKEMHSVRNFRQGFAKGLILGGFQFATQIVTCGAGLCGKLKAHPDAEATKTLKAYKKKPFAKRFASSGRLEFDKETTFDKATDIFYSGVAHDEQQVPHLHVNNPATFKTINIAQYGAPCQYFCPAEVYEVHTDKNGERDLRIHFENCVHCKTCDIKTAGDGITWNVPNGGNGPDYQNM